MSMLLMVKAMGVKVGNSTSKFVLLKLADNANDKGECFPSYQHIADHCEISRRSAINHVNTLCEQGFVRKVYRKGEKGNSSNIFILTLDGENSALGGENSAPDSELDSLPPSENSAPRTSHSFEPVNEPKEKYKKEISPKAKRTNFPDDLTITESNKKLANDLGLNAEFEFNKFKDRNLSIGGQYVNWDSAFSNWLRRAFEFKGGKSNQSTPKQKQMTPEQQAEYEKYMFMQGLS